MEIVMVERERLNGILLKVDPQGRSVQCLYTRQSQFHQMGKKDSFFWQVRLSG